MRKTLGHGRMIIRCNDLDIRCTSFWCMRSTASTKLTVLQCVLAIADETAELVV